MICNKPVGELGDDQLYELCYLRFLSYKHRLISPTVAPNDYYVQYNDCKISDPANAGSPIDRIRTEANFALIGNNIAGWLNGHRFVASQVHLVISYAPWHMF